jgi:hypothetical protein
MKTRSLRHLILAAVALVALVAFAPPAAAAVDIGVAVGGPPPAPYHEHRWARPYPGAVWIPGYHEWRDGRWVWIGGYWGYPPYPGAIWVGPVYRHGFWHHGYWRR